MDKPKSVWDKIDKSKLSKEQIEVLTNRARVCSPLCLKHDVPRPCPICDKKGES
jgi:rubrerythrin